VPESGPLGSVRGARGNLRPYRDTLEDASITIRAAKTRGGPHLWDQSAGSLMTGRAATGV